LIIHRKKFDIRQWVLVTDWNPLTVYIYNECYVRFAAMDYDTKNKSKFAHLTNNVITKEYHSPSPNKKNSKKFREPSADPNEEDVEEEEELDNIWSLDDFKEYLNKNHAQPAGEQELVSEDVFTNII
jgi:hypothetical protein